MRLDFEKCKLIENISEEEEFALYGRLLQYIKNHDDVNTLKILECISSIMNAYYTGFYTKPNPYKYIIEQWIMQHWDISSIEITEYVTEIAIRLELENLYEKIKDTVKNRYLPSTVIKELKDTIQEADNGEYFSRNQPTTPYTYHP